MADLGAAAGRAAAVQAGDTQIAAELIYWTGRARRGLGHPYLALRLRIADPERHGPPPRTPRLPLTQVVDTSAVPSAHL